MKYIASVRDKETKELMIIEREYDTKKHFYDDLRGNNFAVRFITTEEKFDEDCVKYHEMWEKIKESKKCSMNQIKNMQQNYT